MSRETEIESNIDIRRIVLVIGGIEDHKSLTIGIFN